MTSGSEWLRRQTGNRPRGLEEQSPRVFDKAAFDMLDPLGKLRAVVELRKKREMQLLDVNPLRAQAVLQTLLMDQYARENKDIGIVVVANTQNGQIHTRFPQWQRWKVFALVPMGDVPGTVTSSRNYFYTHATNAELQSQLGEGNSVDEIVNKNAFDIRPERPIDARERTMLELGPIFREIKAQSTSPIVDQQTLEELRHWEVFTIIQFLRASLDMEKEEPKLQGKLFRFNGNMDNDNLVALEMQWHEDKDRLQYLRYKRTTRTAEVRGSIHKTNIRPRRLREFLADPSLVTDSVEIRSELAEILKVPAGVYGESHGLNG